MIKKMLFWTVVVLVMAVLAHFVIKEITTTEEDRVRSVLDSLISGVESNSSLVCQTRLMDNLSLDYVHRGERADITIDKALALRYLVGLKQQSYKDFQAEIRDMQITVTGQTAHCVLTGRVTAALKDKPGDRVELLTVGGFNRAIIDLAKENDRWQVIGSQRVEHDFE